MPEEEIDDLQRFGIEQENLTGSGFIRKVFAIPNQIKIVLDEQIISKYFVDLNVDRSHKGFTIYTGILRTH